jgi:hypothetical protein
MAINLVENKQNIRVIFQLFSKDSYNIILTLRIVFNVYALYKALVPDF